MTYLNAKKYMISAPYSNGKGHSNILELLDSLGSPQRRMKYLRLAGSNGKTVCAEMLTSVLIKGGYTVGCLRMPLREEPTDNVCIGNKCLSMDQFAQYTSAIKRLGAGLDFIPTQSELLLSVALLAFKDAGCDICIIESDHFGEDPSRFLPPPFAAVICGTIPSDDTEQITRIRSYICRGIEEIVSAPQNSEAYSIISDTCYSVNCRLTLPTRNAISIDKLTFRGSEFHYKNVKYTLSLSGRFQISNAVLVIETLEMLARKGFSISVDNINAGLSNLRIPAKFETVSLFPLIIVDSTHTPVAIETVCDSLSDFKAQTGTNVRLCLPSGKIIPDYVDALERRGYTIESIYTPASDGIASDSRIVPCNTQKALVNGVLSNLDKNTLLLVSGNHKFVIPVRHRMLEALGFRF
ncbi:MAG: hypothetical protein IJZ83_10535 [Clostridia bacterium]|nr:hypothetical protein [Clostridia bacterium]